MKIHILNKKWVLEQIYCFYPCPMLTTGLEDISHIQNLRIKKLHNNYSSLLCKIIFRNVLSSFIDLLIESSQHPMRKVRNISLFLPTIKKTG